MSDLAARIQQVKAGYDSCFGCGPANPIGLQLDGFALDEGRLSTTFVPRPHYRGFDGVLHGGIVATALDEMMAWAAIALENVMAVTAKMELWYRNPAPPDEALDLTAWINERRGRRLQIEATCSCGDIVLAEAAGVFLVSHELED